MNATVVAGKCKTKHLHRTAYISQSHSEQLFLLTVNMDATCTWRKMTSLALMVIWVLLSRHHPLRCPQVYEDDVVIKSQRVTEESRRLG